MKCCSEKCYNETKSRSLYNSRLDVNWRYKDYEGRQLSYKQTIKFCKILYSCVFLIIWDVYMKMYQEILIFAGIWKLLLAESGVPENYTLEIIMEQLRIS
ncbi:hypothetical protein SAMN05661044_00730 [Olivibacter domesticus]|uniref:Uncharacterized protein n=1 Tax=Olivibacter domesticus TaxID=407022 RepID=A0A1H7ILZ4_OLID1|nr:hypothetical protein SAMN05661044_00730 [Olivibacter domesticus]